MAVLRASRLFLLQIGPTGAITGQDDPKDFPEPRDTASLFHCPPDHKAILRSFTAVTKGVPPQSPMPYMHLKCWAYGGAGAIAIFFHWFYDPNTTPNTIQYGATWHGDFVMQPNDDLVMYNGAGTTLDISASGHILPIQSLA